MKKSLFALGLSFLMGAMAHAGVITDTWESGLENLGSDNGGQLFLSRTGSTTAAVGDVILGSFIVDTLEASSLIHLNTLSAEWTGLLAVKIVDVIDNGTSFSFVLGALDASDIAFVASQGLVDVAAELSTWAAGSIIATFEDPTRDYVRHGGTAADMLELGYEGDKLFELGLDGVDDSYIASGVPTLDFADFASYASSAGVGQVDFELSVTANNTDFIFGDVLGSDSQFTGNINLLIPTNRANTPYNLFADLNFTFAPEAVPEPSSMVLMGLGALGMGVMAVRRRKVAVAG